MAATNSLLVVGGSGFIGRHLVKAAIGRGYRTTVVSLNEVHASKKISGVDYVRANISDLTELSNLFPQRKFTHVVNLGGYVDHSRFRQGGQDVINAHYLGVVNLLRCLDWDVLETFVQIGSSDEYGDASSPISESVRETPISPYSFAKVAATQLLQMLHKTEKFPAVILRLFLVYGSEQGKQRFLPQVIDGCLRKESFAASHGEQLRDLCYVDDVVSGILAALSSSSAYGEIVNIASGEPVSIRSVIEDVVAAVGAGVPRFGEIPYRQSESMALYADISKAKELLAWEPEIDLAEGIAKTISFYKKSHG
jgi:nucleoside-diphosphate-sugar epimerase